jgi:hypothetical protein
MFRVRDAVKFGASRVCPMCNSGFGSPVDSTAVQTPDRLLSRFWNGFGWGAT